MGCFDFSNQFLACLWPDYIWLLKLYFYVVSLGVTKMVWVILCLARDLFFFCSLHSQRFSSVHFLNELYLHLDTWASFGYFLLLCILLWWASFLFIYLSMGNQFLLVLSSVYHNNAICDACQINIAGRLTTFSLWVILPSFQDLGMLYLCSNLL